jgi:hypothetical protein
MANKDINAKAKTAKMKAKPEGYMGTDRAAAKYVKAGLSKLNVSPAKKAEIYEKLVPIVSRQMGTERGRTATRAAGIAKREAKNAVSKANKKILGGK